MRDLRREQTHGVARGATLEAVQVVADRAVIDDQQRPGVVDVHGVGVLGEVCVENLHDARDWGAPGGDLLPGHHAKNVQDAEGADPGVSKHEKRR